TGHHHDLRVLSTPVARDIVTPGHTGGVEPLRALFGVDPGDVGIGDQLHRTAARRPYVCGQGHRDVAVVGGTLGELVAGCRERLHATLEAVPAEGATGGLGIDQQVAVRGLARVPARLQDRVLLWPVGGPGGRLGRLDGQAERLASAQPGLLLGAHRSRPHGKGGFYPLVIGDQLRVAEREAMVDVVLAPVRARIVVEYPRIRPWAVAIVMLRGTADPGDLPDE